MVSIGSTNKLRIIKHLPIGLYLDGQELGEILLPSRYVPAGALIGQSIEVFLYTDSEDRLIATTQKPYAQVGEFAFLKVVEVNETGAFLDWGLPKDLLVPFRQQKTDMKPGKSYIVAIYLDKLSNRIAASARIEKFLNKTFPDLAEQQQVDILICDQTDIGFNAIINNSFMGLLYTNETFQPLHKGDTGKAWIKKTRPDGKIDLTLSQPGLQKIDDLAAHILTELKRNGGFLPVHDNSPADTIYGMFQQSKRAFKTALGSLYKQRLITIGNDGIRITDNTKKT